MTLTPLPDEPHPYHALTPDVVLDALASLGLYGDGRLMALGSYENRVYQVHLEDGSKVVTKFYRPGRWSDTQIQEEHRFAFDLVQDEVPVVAPLRLQGDSVHHYAGFAFSVSPWRGGRQPELDDGETLEWIGRFLARLHTVGSQQPFTHRAHLNIDLLGWQARNTVLDAQVLPPEVRSAWADTSQQALEMIAQGRHAMGDFGDLTLSQAPVLRLHGDCHPGNILWTPPSDTDPGGPHFVDLDDTCTGPAVQDLWMLLSGDRPQQTRNLSALLDGYEQVRDFDRRELTLIEPLRTLRIIHYSAWLTRRWSDPAFPQYFPWFAAPDYWSEQERQLQAQISAMQAPVLMA